MSRKSLIWLTVLVIVSAIAFFAWRQYTRTIKDLIDVKPELYTSAMTLIKEYESNDSTANKKYLGKIIETVGMIKKIEKDEKNYYTIVIGDTASLSSVRCAIDSIHSSDVGQLTNHSSITLRGACTGFNKDDMGLGSDVILNRCVIIQQKKN